MYSNYSKDFFGEIKHLEFSNTIYNIVRDTIEDSLINPSRKQPDLPWWASDWEDAIDFYVYVCGYEIFCDSSFLLSKAKELNLEDHLENFEKYCKRKPLLT